MITMYINAFAQLLAMLFVFLATRLFAYQLTNIWGLPKWLQYRPFNCEICFTFWMLVAIFTTVLIIGYTWMGVSGLIMAVLNAIAMKVDQKRKTVSRDEIEKMEL